MSRQKSNSQVFQDLMTHTHHLFQVRAELVELVHRPDVDSPRVLVHHQVVELRALLVRQAPLIRELSHYVQATALGKRYYQ